MGLRFRIGAIFFMGVLPAIVTLGAQIALISQDEIAQSEARAKTIAAEIAGKHGDAIRAAELVLTQLKDSPDARDGSMPNCQAIFSNIVRSEDSLTSAWVTDRMGKVLCSDLGTPSFSRADRPDFIEAMRSGEFTIGQYRIGQATGRAVVPISVPVRDPRGVIAGTFGAAMDMSAVLRRTSAERHSSSILIFILDNDGVVLFSNRNPEKFVGAHVSKNVSGDAEIDGFSASNFDGIARIFSGVSIDDPKISIRVGVAEGDVSNSSLTQSQQLAIVLVVSALIGGYLIFWGLGRFVTRPVQLLTATAADIAGGNAIEVPESVQQTPGEIGELSRMIAAMTHNLQRREIFLRSITDNLPAAISYFDKENRFRFVNRTAEEWFGKPRSELIGVKFEQMSDPRRHEQVAIAVARTMAGHRTQAESKAKYPDGTERWINLIRIPDIDDRGEVLGYFRLSIDITDRKIAELEAVEKGKFIESIADNLPISIAYIDAGGEFKFVNRTSEIWNARTREEMIGEQFDAFVKLEPEDRSEITKVFSGQGTHAEKQLSYPDGITRWVEVTRIPDFGENGEVRGYFRMIVDISERKQADQAKEEFISTMNHELRTPLTSIKGSLSLLKSGVGGALPETASQLVSVANNNSERLVRLINDILDAQKIASGKLELALAPLGLDSLLTEAIEANKGYADLYSVRYRLIETVPLAWVQGDRDRLMQVMANLLSNAAKFSPANMGVEIALAKHGNFYRISVHDHGAGIPPEFQNKIFGRFAQAHASDDRQRGGTGLGLNICHSIVSAHGGKIGFSCEPSQGTTFYFDLPIQEEA